MNVAVITGASMGLGEEFARQLAARRQNLLLIARSGDKLEKIAADLEAKHNIRAKVFVCDLSEVGAAQRISEFISEKGLNPTWLVNNAGFGGVGTFDAMDFDSIHGMMMVNMVALVELTHLLLPALRLNRNARIINVASTAAFQPVAFFNVYAASKTFVVNFSEALHEELRGTDVRVLALCPGPTPTNFAENNNLDSKLFEKGQSAADVVHMGLIASDRRRALIICQRKWAVIVQRFLPRFVVRYGAAMVAKQMLKKGVHGKHH